MSYFVKYEHTITDDTQVWLEGGETGFTSSGFVEMYINNRWGLVVLCNMNAADDDSACRQLRYINTSSWRH